MAAVQVTIFKDRYTEEQLKKLGLNARQIKAVQYAKESRIFLIRSIRNCLKLSKATSTRDLTQLVDNFKILQKEGTTGAGTSYILNGLIIGSIGS